MNNCVCGGEAVVEHEGSKYFVCCLECPTQTKETFFEQSDAIKAWDNNETEKP